MTVKKKGHQMRLVRVDADGNPVDPVREMKVQLPRDGNEILVTCHCGMVYTARVPEEGKCADAECPRDGCGGGIEMDRRITFEPVLRPPLKLKPLEDTLKDLTYPTPEEVQNAFRMPPGWPERMPTMEGRANLERALKRRGTPVVEALRELCGTCKGRGKVGTPSPFEGTSLPDDVEEYQAMARAGVLERNCPDCGGSGYAKLRDERFEREYLCEPVPVAFDWFCGFCLLGYYSPDVERSDEQMRPLCRCGRVLNGAAEQPPGLRWVGETHDA